jgi:hypothetical protein
MTKRFHKCGEECEVHNTIVADSKKRSTPKKASPKPKTVSEKPDRWTSSSSEIVRLSREVKNEDSFVALQHCIKILEGVKRDHGI